MFPNVFGNVFQFPLKATFDQFASAEIPNITAVVKFFTGDFEEFSDKFRIVNENKPKMWSIPTLEILQQLSDIFQTEVSVLLKTRVTDLKDHCEAGVVYTLPHMFCSVGFLNVLSSANTAGR
jgi:hypothetical protein